MSGPELRPSKKKEERRVFLEPQLWEDLTEAADFHSEVFEALEAEEKVSRNTVIAAFLRWALDEYWKDKGGKPTDKAARAEKIRRHAEKLGKSEK